VGTARVAVGEGDGGRAGAEEGASREAAGDGMPAAGGGAPLLAGAPVEAPGAGAAALPGCLPPQAGAASTHAARARQIGGRTNMVVGPSSRPLPHAPASARTVMLVASCLRW